MNKYILLFLLLFSVITIGGVAMVIDGSANADARFTQSEIKKNKCLSACSETWDFVRIVMLVAFVTSLISIVTGIGVFTTPPLGFGLLIIEVFALFCRMSC